MLVRRKAWSRAHWLGVVALWAATVWSPPVGAYVRSRTPKTFVPLFWADPRQALAIARPPGGPGISEDDLRGAAEAAIATWSQPQVACTGVSLRLSTESTASQAVGRDGTNRIIMRVGNWCPNPKVVDDTCHDQAAVALTTVFSRNKPGTSQDGEIVEADIEVNAVGEYQWAIIPDGPISGRDYANVYDLTSVLTHEAGHFIGLDHNCYLPGAPLLVDDHGVPTVDCSSLPAAIQMSIVDATMYPFMSTADVELRTLTADDARAPCEIYPPSSLPFDEWVGAGGCAITPTPAASGQPGVWLATALMAIVAIFSTTARRRRAAASGLFSRRMRRRCWVSVARNPAR